MDLVEAMNSAPRCGARTRCGGTCEVPAVKGKRRCWYHGGAPGSGAPIGNQNALKHGRWSAEEIQFRRMVSTMIKEGKELFEKV